MKTIISLILSGVYLCVLHNTGNAQEKNLPHVLILGIDGLGAHGFGMAETPNLVELMKNGAYSLSARTIVPSSSGPAWSSIITGTTVERHGIGNNDWTIYNKELQPVYEGKYSMFPTIFGEIREHYPKAVIGAIYQWSSFGNFIEKNVCNVSTPVDSEDIATRKACELLSTNMPDFTFVHLDLVDHAGHHSGYRSAEYKKSVEKVDSLIGVFIAKLKDTGMLDQAVVFIVADHGGFDKSHGGTHADEMIVPFIIYGKGVKRGYIIKHPVFNYDLAPTVAWLFGFKLNEWITGKPLSDAFN